MTGFQETATFNGKLLHETPVFINSHKSGVFCDSLKAPLGQYGSYVQIVFDGETQSIVAITFEDKRMTNCNVYTNATNYTIQDLRDIVLDNYAIHLEDWEIIFD